MESKSLVKYIWQFVRTNSYNNSLILLATGVSLNLCHMKPRALHVGGVQLALVRHEYKGDTMTRALAIVKAVNGRLELPEVASELMGVNAYIVPERYFQELNNWGNV